jgi:ParB family transcriptional regulator, chromosome partitioning protein
MTNAVQKITLSASRDIPFNKLVLSQANVRRIKAGMSIEELAEDIARRGLLQGLNVRPIIDEEGTPTDMFEIPAGGRRYEALCLLVKQKRLAKTTPVPCVVREGSSDILAADDSLAENIQRVALHPLDQFRAFQTLRDKGQSEEAIAASFFVGVNVVKQRLRLAAVSPVLLEVYAQDAMSLEQLMAFAVTSDHARQEQIWAGIATAWSKEPYQIRRLLTQTTVRASDKRALFIGLEAYEEAGGIVLRDLFQSDDGGWLQDAALLDLLVAQKLKASAEEIAKEGWKWIAVAISHPYDAARGMRALAGTRTELTAAELAEFDALQADYDRIEAAYEGVDELPQDIDQQLGQMEQALAAFSNRPVTYDPANMARAGVFVSIAHDGVLSVDRGFVRPEDEAVSVIEHDADPETAIAEASSEFQVPTAGRAIISIEGQSDPGCDEDDDDTIRALPDRLLTELTAHRTLALRDGLANNPAVALTALLHTLVRDTFQRTPSSRGCLEASVRPVFLPVQADDLNDSPPAKAISARQEAWKADLPTEDDALWDWLQSLDDARRLSLLAHCVSFGVNALHEKVDRTGGARVSSYSLNRRLSEANRLARAVGLDMVEAGWQPTVANYLGRVTKSRILEAVRQAKGEQAAQLIASLKKDDMAKEAERLLDASGWLPEPLRLRNVDDAVEASRQGNDETPVAPALPAEDDADANCEKEQLSMIAAE